jgi:hypothetical protein
VRVDNELVVDAGGLRLRILDVRDPQRFLQFICDTVFQMAETIEERSKDPEREAVRADVRMMSEYVPALALGMLHTEDLVLRNLLDAALDPLDTTKASWVAHYKRAAKEAGLPDKGETPDRPSRGFGEVRSPGHG